MYEDENVEGHQRPTPKRIYLTLLMTLVVIASFVSIVTPCPGAIQ